MNRRLMTIVAGSLAALILGFATAYPFLIPEFPSLSRAELNVDVVYAYIAPLDSKSNLTGLWWNDSIVESNYGNTTGSAYQADGLVVSYLVVLNITNHSNEYVRIDSFDMMIGPQISINNYGGTDAVNPVVTDSRHFAYFDAETDDVWNPQQWKLIGLSGVIGVHETPYPSLNATVFLYGSVEGQIAYNGPSQYTKEYCLKQVRFQRVENAYIYNVLLGENQILVFYQGLEVSVATRR
jgi:hypothetical protein